MADPSRSSVISIGRFDKLGFGISWLASRTVRRAAMMVVLYLVVIGVGLNAFRTTPGGFIPQVDRGYIIVVVQLPPGASLARTERRQAARARPSHAGAGRRGCPRTSSVFPAPLSRNAANPGALFLVLDDFQKRGRDPRQSAAAIQAQAAVPAAVLDTQDAFIIPVLPPPVMGIGTAGGFRMMVEDRAGRGFGRHCAPRLNRW